jgi:hypothetical protein
MDSLRSPQEAATPEKADPSVAFQSAQGRVLESRSLGMTALVERSKKSVRPILAICAKKRPGQGLQTGLKAQVAVQIQEQPGANRSLGFPQPSAVCPQFFRRHSHIRVTVTHTRIDYVLAPL